ncbi:MAG TPA: glycoside hydrolase family 38 C-terminal domain-containing protein, partial [Thermoanaerobaculia bacterium]|nr:glycoside hydrolase family 38 C-terminal domain-containing protein [Thermoanaerobaculia bacterium]
SARFEELAAAGRPPLLMTYTGCGDRGGAPAADSVAALERSLDGDGPIEVRHGGSERIFLETGADERRQLPVHEGELLLRLHATGCYTAKAAAKRGNRRGERLARAAEAATASARALGARAPLARLEEAWWRLLAHQMHDDLTGTSIPAAYRLTLEDQAIAANELAEILRDAVARVARDLDRSGPGRPLVLFNPLGLEREELVELPLGPGDGARILGPQGDELPTQVGVGEDGGAVLLVRARLEPFGFLVLRRIDGGPAAAAGAEIPADGLDDGRLSARFDPEGNLAGLLDRAAGRELLAGPVRLELFADRSAKYPAWEILWEDLARGPLEAAPRGVAIRALERGPLRHSREVERRLPGARLRERWSIGASDGDRLDWDVRLLWSGRSRLLKSAFRLAHRAAEATYDTGLAPVRRGLSSEALYEVPAQHWAALADRDGGVAILSDLKSGWDHPDPSTLRATWIHAPRASWKWRHQRSQDDGPHRFRFALTGFAGDPAGAGLPARAERFVHPLLAFAAEPGGAGPLGRRWSALGLEPGTAVAQALKVSEEGRELVLRLRNPGSRPARVAGLPEGARVRLLDGRERPLSDDGSAPGGATAAGSIEVPAAGLVTLGIEVGAPVASEPEAFRPLPLPLDLRATAARGEADAHGFDGTGLRFPAELWPARVEGAVVPFELGRADAASALAARGQTLELPAGWIELWLLAAAVGGALEVELALEAWSARLRIPDWRGPAFDPRGSRPCRLPLAWVSPFLRDRRGRDRIAEPGLLHAFRIPLAGGGGLLRLPERPQLRVVAATLAAAPARPVDEASPLLG